MAMTKITNLIDTDNKSEYITKMWTAAYPVLREKYVLTSKLGKVNIADAKKYEGDLEGLLRDKLEIRQEYILPTMLVNGYINSQSYKGDKLEFVYVDDRMLNRYLQAFKRSEVIRKK